MNKSILPLKIEIEQSSGILVTIEGNICSGKSTLYNKLRVAFGSPVFLEPALNNPYLTEFYKNPKKFAFKMQIYLLFTRFAYYVKAVELSRSKIVILDQSIWSDKVFAHKNWLDGNISDDEYNTYLQLHKELTKKLPLPSVMLFLKCKAEKCFERIKKVRCRNCEVGIELKYLKGLENGYNSMRQSLINKYDKITNISTKSDIIAINWNTFSKSKYDVVKSMIENSDGINNVISNLKSKAKDDIKHVSIGSGRFTSKLFKPIVLDDYQQWCQNRMDKKTFKCVEPSLKKFEKFVLPVIV